MKRSRSERKIPNVGCEWYQPTIFSVENRESISWLMKFHDSWVKVTSPARLVALSQRIDSETLTNGPFSSRCQSPTSTPQISIAVFSAA